MYLTECLGHFLEYELAGATMRETPQEKARTAAQSNRRKVAWGRLAVIKGDHKKISSALPFAFCVWLHVRNTKISRLSGPVPLRSAAAEGRNCCFLLLRERRISQRSHVRICRTISCRAHEGESQSQSSAVRQLKVVLVTYLHLPLEWRVAQGLRRVERTQKLQPV